MAQVYDQKSSFYSNKQSIRDELLAPQYLESAGDDLIRNLVKNQTNTSTSLQEQLKIVQNFEKGFELSPDDRKGILSLADFKTHQLTEPETSSTKGKEITNVDELIKITGLSRHELELTLCEKPNSTISQLYMFAIANKKQKEKCETPEYKLPNHPINHLKEIEKEYFDSIRNKQSESESPVESKRRKTQKRKKQRKRKKKSKTNNSSELVASTMGSLEEQTTAVENETFNASKPSRPSLWDVKDMKTWSEPKIIGCKPPALYTIKNGKIIKLNEESGNEDTT